LVCQMAGLFVMVPEEYLFLSTRPCSILYPLHFYTPLPATLYTLLSMGLPIPSRNTPHTLRDPSPVSQQPYPKHCSAVRVHGVRIVHPWQLVLKFSKHRSAVPVRAVVSVNPWQLVLEFAKHWSAVPVHAVVCEHPWQLVLEFAKHWSAVPVHAVAAFTSLAACTSVPKS
jgi:hypothetical protein